MLDGLLVPLDGPAFRHLAAPLGPPQEFPDVAGVVADPKRLPYYLCNALQGPKVVRVTIGPGSVQQDLPQAQTLVLAELPGSPRDGLGLQRVLARLFVGGLPPVDRTRRGTYLAGRGRDAPACVQQGDGLPPSPFQRLGGTEGSHASCVVTFLTLLAQNSIIRLRGCGSSPYPSILRRRMCASLPSMNLGGYSMR